MLGFPENNIDSLKSWQEREQRRLEQEQLNSNLREQERQAEVQSSLEVGASEVIPIQEEQTEVPSEAAVKQQPSTGTKLRPEEKLQNYYDSKPHLQGMKPETVTKSYIVDKAFEFMGADETLTFDMAKVMAHQELNEALPQPKDPIRTMTPGATVADTTQKIPESLVSRVYSTPFSVLSQVFISGKRVVTGVGAAGYSLARAGALESIRMFENITDIVGIDLIDDNSSIMTETSHFLSSEEIERIRSFGGLLPKSDSGIISAVEDIGSVLLGGKLLVAVAGPAFALSSRSAGTLATTYAPAAVVTGLSKAGGLFKGIGKGTSFGSRAIKAVMDGFAFDVVGSTLFEENMTSTLVEAFGSKDQADYISELIKKSPIGTRGYNLAEGMFMSVMIDTVVGPAAKRALGKLWDVGSKKGRARAARLKELLNKPEAAPIKRLYEQCELAFANMNAKQLEYKPIVYGTDATSGPVINLGADTRALVVGTSSHDEQLMTVLDTMSNFMETRVTPGLNAKYINDLTEASRSSLKDFMSRHGVPTELMPSKAIDNLQLFEVAEVMNQYTSSPKFRLWMANENLKTISHRLGIPLPKKGGKNLKAVTAAMNKHSGKFSKLRRSFPPRRDPSSFAPAFDTKGTVNTTRVTDDVIEVASVKVAPSGSSTQAVTKKLKKSSKNLVKPENTNKAVEAELNRALKKGGKALELPDEKVADISRAVKDISDNIKGEVLEPVAIRGRIDFVPLNKDKTTGIFISDKPERDLVRNLFGFGTASDKTIERSLKKTSWNTIEEASEALAKKYNLSGVTKDGGIRGYDGSLLLDSNKEPWKYSSKLDVPAFRKPRGGTMDTQVFQEIFERLKLPANMALRLTFNGMGGLAATSYFQWDLDGDGKFTYKDMLLGMGFGVLVDWGVRKGLKLGTRMENRAFISELLKDNPTADLMETAETLRQLVKTSLDKPSLTKSGLTPDDILKLGRDLESIEDFLTSKEGLLQIVKSNKFTEMLENKLAYPEVNFKRLDGRALAQGKISKKAIGNMEVIPDQFIMDEQFVELGKLLREDPSSYIRELYSELDNPVLKSEAIVTFNEILNATKEDLAKNFGISTSAWDRLVGSGHEPREALSKLVGIKGYLSNLDDKITSFAKSNDSWMDYDYLGFMKDIYMRGAISRYLEMGAQVSGSKSKLLQRSLDNAKRMELYQYLISQGSDVTKNSENARRVVGLVRSLKGNLESAAYDPKKFTQATAVLVANPTIGEGALTATMAMMFSNPINWSKAWVENVIGIGTKYTSELVGMAWGKATGDVPRYESHVAFFKSLKDNFLFAADEAYKVIKGAPGFDSGHSVSQMSSLQKMQIARELGTDEPNLLLKGFGLIEDILGITPQGFNFQIPTTFSKALIYAGELEKLKTRAIFDKAMTNGGSATVESLNEAARRLYYDTNLMSKLSHRAVEVGRQYTYSNTPDTGLVRSLVDLRASTGAAGHFMYAVFKTPLTQVRTALQHTILGPLFTNDYSLIKEYMSAASSGSVVSSELQRSVETIGERVVAGTLLGGSLYALISNAGYDIVGTGSFRSQGEVSAEGIQPNTIRHRDTGESISYGRFFVLRNMFSAIADIEDIYEKFQNLDTSDLDIVNAAQAALGGVLYSLFSQSQPELVTRELENLVRAVKDQESMSRYSSNKIVELANRCLPAVVRMAGDLTEEQQQEYNGAIDKIHRVLANLDLVNKYENKIPTRDAYGSPLSPSAPRRGYFKPDDELGNLIGELGIDVSNAFRNRTSLSGAELNVHNPDHRKIMDTLSRYHGDYLRNNKAVTVRTIRNRINNGDIEGAKSQLTTMLSKAKTASEARASRSPDVGRLIQRLKLEQQQ